MKKIALLFLVGLGLSLPSLAMAAFYQPIPGMFPGTTEGSGISSATFTAVGGSTITFNYNFISGEYSSGGVEVDDLFGAGLLDPVTGNFLGIGSIITVSSAGMSDIDGGSTVYGPEGDYFIGQTGSLTYSYTVPTELNGADVQFAIGVFDVEDTEVASAVLIDNVSLLGGDFEDDPFSLYGYFVGGMIPPTGVGEGPLDGGPAGLFDWSGNESFDLDSSITEPGSGSFAYISTYDAELPPVPVPGAVWLLGSGLIGLVGVRRKFIS